MLEFARAYPIGRTSGQLSWGQIQALLAVNENEKREALIKRAQKENWTVDKTRSEVKKLKAAKQITVSEAPTDGPLIPIKGTLDTYRVVLAAAGPWQGKRVVDLGFSNYHRPARDLTFNEKEIIQVSEKGRLTRLKNAAEEDLFTYRAWILNTTDGDTIWALIDLGFGFITKQHLRLRGLDASEIASRDGIRAKRFVEKELGVAASERISKSSRAVIGAPVPMIITSTKSDKYDRYLADVWIGGKHLNQLLLDQGLAVKI
jgi:endonuclease YncB( thermonuclease family)